MRYEKKEMSQTPLSDNKQLAIGGADYFPNKRQRYKKLLISHTKARRDQRVTRQIEAITKRPESFRRNMNSQDPTRRRKTRQALQSILGHYYDQSILANEKSQFPGLPKESVLDVDVPPKGFTVVKTRESQVMSGANFRDDLLNPFVPTNFQKLTDCNINTPAIVIAGREQPYGGAQETSQTYQVPRFLPNPAYGGTDVRYR